MGTQRRIPVGPLIGLLGAVLLLVSLFLNWWDGATAFTVFEVLDLLLALLAIGAAMSLAEAAGARMPAGVALGAAVALPLGLLALLIVFSQIVNDPPAIAHTGRGHDLGIWLALGGALLIVAGSLLSVARVSLALDLERRERAGPPADEGPEPKAGEPAPRRRGEPRDAGAVEPEAPTVAEEGPERAARPARASRPEPPVPLEPGDPERPA
jgi:hypothetical protein